MAPSARFVGRRVKRVEDPRLLRGQARYIDDLVPNGVLHVVFVRSPHAHAGVLRIDRRAAGALSGVAAVLTAGDVTHLLPKPISIQPSGFHAVPRAPLADGSVSYVGQPVAAVVARDRYVAEDAAALVAVDYEPRPAVVTPEQALDPAAPRVHASLPSNIAFEHAWTAGDVDGAFRRAARVVRARFVQPRIAAAPLEPRGCVADYDGSQLTVWISTQMPHRVRRDLSAVLAWPEHRIRVIAPEVGGSFGCKVGLYDDELVAVAAAVRLGRSVKWVETRSENLVATAHGRGQVLEAELAVDALGVFLGLRVRSLADVGAFVETFTAGPPMQTGRLITGAYKIPAASFALHGLYTHKTPLGSYRGAGRPEATYVIERLADVAAAEIGVDPVDIRRRNLIGDREFPYRVPSGLTFDSGRYETTLDRALALAGYTALRREQGQARREGRLLGIGLATFVEPAGTGPSRLMPFEGWEYGSVRVEPSGRVVVVTGISPHGQGQETTFAQIVADELGIDLEDVAVVHGDTAIVPAGFGTGGSRGTAVGGTAVYLAVQTVKDKARRIAAHLLEVAAEDIVWDRSDLRVHEVPARAVTFREVAREAHRAEGLPAGMEPGLEASRAWDPPAFTAPFGAYVAVVEVLPDTAEVLLHRFVGVDDVGRILSPLLVEGQLHGGIVQGVGQALLEEIVHDSSAQCLTQTLMDYALPKAAHLVRLELDNTVTATPVNPLGAKGVGEAGAVGAPAAVMNAVCDALRPLGIRDVGMPAAPLAVWTAMRRARADGTLTDRPRTARNNVGRK
jgi:carbon-monoxide dehydrogenase large subunit